MTINLTDVDCQLTVLGYVHYRPTLRITDRKVKMMVYCTPHIPLQATPLCICIFRLFIDYEVKFVIFESQIGKFSINSASFLNGENMRFRQAIFNMLIRTYTVLLKMAPKACHSAAQRRFPRRKINIGSDQTGLFPILYYPHRRNKIC